MTDKTTFIVTRSPSSAWDEELPMHKQVGWDDHAHFMDDITASGFIYIGGPLTDSREYLFVIEAEDAGEVWSTFTRDPWEAADILATRQVRPWTVLLDSRKNT